MKKIFLLLFLFASQTANALNKVVSISATLHDKAKGDFSYDLLKSGPLGNGILSYNGLLVVVEVTGSGGVVKLTLTEQGKPKRNLFSTQYNFADKSFLPAFVPLNKAGCLPIEIEVSDFENGKKKLLKKELLPFGPCHE